MCPGSLRVVKCGPFARTVACPICGRKVKPLRKTLDGRRAQLKSHTGAPRPEGPDDSATGDKEVVDHGDQHPHQ